MSKPKRVFAALAGGVIAVYAAIALSPLTAWIGRSDPALATCFRPLLFNFSSTYETGQVLDFHIGMSRGTFFTVLATTYSGKGRIIVNCTVSTGNSLVPITADLDVASIYGGGDRLCASMHPDGPGFEVSFQGESVARIKLWYVRTEMP
jgi:hypothetical protein